MRMRARTNVAALAVGLAMLLFGAAAGWAFQVDQPLDDPALEARALHLHQQLRCLVCQGQAISDSNAELARDLRQIVRERIAAGETDAQVKQYLVARYGDFVLLNPPVKASTYVLWFGPALILLLGAAGVFFLLRRSRGRAVAAAPLSADERRRVEALLDDDDS